MIPYGQRVVARTGGKISNSSGLSLMQVGANFHFPLPKGGEERVWCRCNTIVAAKARTHALNQFLGTSRYEFACHVDVASFRLVSCLLLAPRTIDLDNTL
jgi:hypothetical protein